MLVNIYTEVLTVMKSTLADCKVLGAYPNVAPSFPLVILTETVNNTLEDTIDTSGEKHAEVTLTFDIFSDAEDKISVVRDIRERIDAIMADTYRMSRVNVGDITNYSDPNIYRYIVRYNGIVDSNKTIHRR